MNEGKDISYFRLENIPVKEETLRGHSKTITSIAVSSSAEFMFSTCKNGTIIKC